MRILTWNVNRARASSPLWGLFEELSPDIAVLQEVSGIPKRVLKQYSVIERCPQQKNGTCQGFRIAVLYRGELESILPFGGPPTVREVLRALSENVIPVKLYVKSAPLYLVGVYVPPWALDDSFAAPLLERVDRSIAAGNSRKLWLTEFLWAWLKEFLPADIPFVLAGDFNVAETFKFNVQSNKETIRRFFDLWLVDALYYVHGGPVPTYLNPKRRDDPVRRAEHQIDYVFISETLKDRIQNAFVPPQEKVFGSAAGFGDSKMLSDHLPVVVDLDIDA